MKACSLLFFSILLTLTAATAIAEVVTVSTLIANSPLDIADALTFGPDGRLYSSPLSTQVRAIDVESGSVEIYGTMLNGSLDHVFHEGSLYVANYYNSDVEVVPPGGGIAVTFTNLSGGTAGLEINNAATDLYCSHYLGNVITRIPLDGSPTETFAGGGQLNGPVGMFFDQDGLLYVGNYNDPKILTFDSQGNESILIQLPLTSGGIGYICWDGIEWIYATSISDNRVFRIPLDGSGYEVLAGTGVSGGQDGEGSQATFNQPNGIVVGPSGNKIYVSEWGGRSIRVIEISSETSVDDPPIVPASIRLGRNFPNPFNPSTRIEFVTGRAGLVSVSIHDAAGRSVLELLSERRERGRHSVLWDGKDDGDRPMPSGIYHYVLRSGDTQLSERMLLLK